MSNSTLIKSLPIVAAAMGKKHGIKVSIRADMNTAATDGKNIYLPIIPDTHEALVLARGYIDHESAHIRFTDFTVNMGKGLRKSLINILEDIRIEQRLGRELPGCKINLEELERSFVDNNIYDVVTTKSHPAEILCAHIHHGLRVNVLGNACTAELAENASRVFAEAFPPAIVSGIDDLLKEGDSLRDTAHVADLTDRILAIIKQEQSDSQDEDQQQGDSQPQSDEGEESDDQQQGGSQSQSDEGEEGDDQQQGGSQSQSDQGEEGEDQQQGDSQSQSDEGEEGDDQQQGGSQSQSDQGDDQQQDQKNPDGNDASQQSASKRQMENLKALKDTQDQEIVSETDLGDKIAQMLGDQNFEALSSGSNCGTFPITVPSPGGRSVDPTEAARETNALRTRLNGLVQASKLRRSPPRRVGSRIDTRSLHKLRTLDTRVFRGSEQKVAVNTGVVVLLVQSSSMTRIKRDATKAAMAVALALDTIPGIKLSVCGFRSMPNESRTAYTPVVSPMKLFNQRIDRNSFVPGAEGGTPLTEGLWWASSELLALQSVERRIVITVTDGDPDDASSVRDVVEKMKHASIENHAIGIGVSINRSLFASSCTITDITELPERVFAMLQDMLVVR
jgi:hypothetical protein